MEVKIDRHTIVVTNPDKRIFPVDGFTKKDVIDYYVAVADYMIPFMQERTLSMQRFPEGIASEGFYHKDAPDYFPSWIKRRGVEKQDGGIVHYVVCNNAATLVYLAQFLCLTPHLALSRIDKIDVPDQMIFDLDPSENNDFSAVCQVALLLKNIVEEAGLVPFVKTTGSRGLHVIVPLKRQFSFDQVRQCAVAIASYAAYCAPQLITFELRKEKRAGKIFIDTLRNAFGATAVAPYAIRARQGAPVAMPIAWHELGKTCHRADQYTIKNAFDRAGCAWSWHDLQENASSLTDLMKKIKI